MAGRERGTQEGTGERTGHPEERGTMLFRGRKSGIDGGATEDLTWGYRTPQDQLYTRIKLIDEEGRKSDGIKKDTEGET